MPRPGVLITFVPNRETNRWPLSVSVSPSDASSAASSSSDFFGGSTALVLLIRFQERQPPRVLASSFQPAGDSWLDLALIEADSARHLAQVLRDHGRVQDAVWHQLAQLESGPVQGVVPLVHRRLGEAIQLSPTGRVRVCAGPLNFGVGNRAKFCLRSVSILADDF